MLVALQHFEKSQLKTTLTDWHFEQVSNLGFGVVFFRMDSGFCWPDCILSGPAADVVRLYCGKLVRFGGWLQ